jgi:hypothetical protein
MTESSRRPATERELPDVRRRIAALYAAHARDIADALRGTPLCVVTGPRRFGKTTSLLPALAGILRRQGKTVHIVNGRDYEGESFSLVALPPGRFDVLIIDEANVLTRPARKMRSVVELLHEKGDALVAQITHFAGYERSALFQARLWKEAEISVSGQTANLVRLPQMLLTPQLATALLMLYSPVRNDVARTQIVSYIVERVPLNPYVLFEVAWANSIREVNEIIRAAESTQFQHALSPEEFRALERSLEG